MMLPMIEIRVTAEQEEPAIESLLRHIPAAPAGYLRHLLQKGKVYRRGIVISAAEPVHPGDNLFLPDSGRLRALCEASAPAAKILFESREILVVDKPAGLAVHRGLGHPDNLTDRLQKFIRLRQEKFRIAPVHRLDATTSGAVIFGKGREAIAALGKLFMAGAVEKTYLALVAGCIAPSGQLATPVYAKGRWKTAHTEFYRMTICGDFSLIQLKLHSGRRHQIRQQLAAAGHPLAGDRRYRGPQPAGLGRLFLHSSQLVLENPFGGERVTIDCPLPEELSSFLAKLLPKTACE